MAIFVVVRYVTFILFRSAQVRNLCYNTQLFMQKRPKSRTYTKYILLVFLLASAAVYGYFMKRTPILWGYHEFYFTPKQYRNTLHQLADERKELTSGGENISQTFIRQFRRLMPFWYGTRYSFYGQTETPGEGKIACGYFVTTVLEDLGLKIERNKLAQLPSEEMIKTLVEKTSIRRFSGYTITDFLAGVRETGTGLYVVGLDTHTGFLLFQNNEMRFIHASGRFPFAVINERASESIILGKSKYRIVGKLSDDKKVLQNWLSNQE
ncbi:hypothetical protein [Emticicia oligotrophica]|uniref:hypothetical protein n=1 Tax=Emticicia oligotrophica TaxID=312279 RepID=UPI00273B0F2C|nr:hypothetical protein [Emticicia oligotrophica]